MKTFNSWINSKKNRTKKWGNFFCEPVEKVEPKKIKHSEQREQREQEGERRETILVPLRFAIIFGLPTVSVHYYFFDSPAFFVHYCFRFICIFGSLLFLFYLNLVSLWFIIIFGSSVFLVQRYFWFTLIFGLSRF